MKKMNLLIIGVGRMGETHLSLYKKINRNLDIFIYDRDIDLSQKIANKYNVKLLKSFSETIDKKIDICDVCLPTYLHFSYIKKAIKLNSHIIVEKPTVISVKQWEILYKILKNYKKIFMCAYVDRFYEPFLYVNNYFKKTGAKIINFTSHRWGNCPQKGSWFLEKNKSGGVLMDLAIHDIDFICSNINQLQMTKFLASVEKTNLEMIFKINKLTIGSISAGWSIPENDNNNFYNDFTILTDKGIISYNSISKDLYIKNQKIHIKSERYPNAYLKELKYFIEKILSNDKNNQKELDTINKTMLLINKINKNGK